MVMILTVPAFPLHSLIFCDDFIPFERHECINIQDVATRLIGPYSRPELASIVFNEVKHLVALKLSLGERVVVAPNTLTAIQQTQLDQIARSQGAFVQRLDCDYGSIQRSPKSEGYASQWQGITVVGDVHGECEFLQQALDWGTARQHFVWFLGDVIDYGSQSLEAMVLVHDAVMHGRAGMILGNHERKIARWLSQDGGRYPLRLSAGNRVTTIAYERLSSQDRAIWAGQFRALLSRCPLIEQIDNFTLTHAAIHPSYWTSPDDPAVERSALYGEGDQSSGSYHPTHRWTDHIPAGQTVIVGHTMLAPLPVMITGKQGGHAVFLDTGSGKGGCLSSADLRYSATGLHLECFRKY